MLVANQAQEVLANKLYVRIFLFHGSGIMLSVRESREELNAAQWDECFFSSEQQGILHTEVIRETWKLCFPFEVLGDELNAVAVSPLHLDPRSVCTRGCSRDRNANANLRPPMEFMMQAVRRYRKIFFKITESASRVFAGPRFLNICGLVSQINSHRGGGGEHGGSLKGWRMELFILWWRYNCP